MLGKVLAKYSSPLLVIQYSIRQWFHFDGVIAEAGRSLVLAI